VIFINQIREKIGVMFGSPETTPGGRALKFYASVRLDLRKVATLKQGEQVIGGRVRCRVVKNKVAPPFREAEFDILHEEGIAKTENILDTAVNLGIVKKTGSWFVFEEEKLGQGREQAVKYLKENPKLLERIEKTARQNLYKKEEEEK
jgi:recombination protein RecA